MTNTWLYILIMAVVIYAIRSLPLTLIRKPIRSVFVQSFLYYVPYVTLAVMTFPAIMEATQSPIAGLAALVVGIVAAWSGMSLLKVAVANITNPPPRPKRMRRPNSIQNLRAGATQPSAFLARSYLVTLSQSRRIAISAVRLVSSYTMDHCVLLVTSPSLGACDADISASHATPLS